MNGPHTPPSVPAPRTRTPCRFPGQLCQRVVGLLLAVALGSVGATAAAPPDAGRWLVQRARGYGFTCGSSPSVGDVELMLVWMQAAARLSPNLPEACLGQHDLLLLLGRNDEAFEVLGRYCTLHPADQRMRLAFLTGSYERLQTADDRTEFCRAQLADNSLPPAIASELHRLLANTCRGVGDMDLARQHAQAACDAYPFNFEAQDLLAELSSEGTTPSQRIGRLLASISAAPARGEPMWTLAVALDSLSMHAQAGAWYLHARRAFERTNPGNPLPLALLLDAARSARDGGDLESALSLCREAMQADPDSFDAALLLIEVARQAGHEDLAEQRVASLRVRLAETEQEVRRQPDALSAARIAWFHVDADPDTAKALEFAQLAAATAGDDPQVRRIHGLALLEAERFEEARATLGSLMAGPEPDQLAAWGLARALVALNERAAALDVLRDAEQGRRSGPAYGRIVALLDELGAAPLPMPDHSRIVAQLAAFVPDVLDFPDRPGRYVKLTAELIDPRPRFGQPWRCQVTLANTATFPITIGEGQMVNGQFLASARVNAPGTEPLEGYLPIPFALVPVLNPGERLTVEETLDVGPLAEIALTMAQRDLEVEFTFILDPVADADRHWSSRLSLDSVASVRLVRPGVEYTASGFGAVMQDLGDADCALRLRGLRTVAGLLAERLLAMRQKLEYTPARIDKKGLEALLQSGLTDPEPVVRAGLLDCLALLPFKEEQASLIAPLLSDNHWLVRLVAVDFLATRQGAVFSPVAERLADGDPDALVRQLARLHLHRLEAEQRRPKPENR